MAGAGRSDLYVPATGCCSLCPYGKRAVCHSARQLAMDRVHAAGDHGSCEFFKEIVRGTIGGGRNGWWWLRLMTAGE